ncbi:MAG TPA: hypothetical protein VHE23_01600 [Candidatus Acidoferrales bacterium]|nr:hypothetical protein [Candidatus Acidoferrales bacterium]
MRKLFVSAWLALFVLGSVPLHAQDKPKQTDAPKPFIPLRLQVVFTEFEGDKKVSSQPYTIFTNSGDQGRTQMRMGVRVPVYTGGKETQAQFQYIDVGTNIDCKVLAAEGGQFRMELNLERSSAYSTSGPVEKAGDARSELQASSSQPTLRTFRSFVTLLLHDGQTLQSNMATDPATGRVLKVDVTLTVVK